MACDVFEVNPDRAMQGKRTMPSRDFLVHQSVLNAAAEVFPTSAYARTIPQTLDTARYLTNIGPDWPEHSILFGAVRKHFRALVESYGGTVCPSR